MRAGSYVWLGSGGGAFHQWVRNLQFSLVDLGVTYYPYAHV